MIFKNGQIYNENFELIKANLQVEDGLITAILDPASELPTDDTVVDIQGKKIIPGFIDVHIHGSNGADTMDGTKEALETMSRYLATKGVTSFLPTTMTTAPEALYQAFSMKPQLSGANMLGFNMEGPYMNVLNRGAHREDQVRPASIEEIRSYMELATIKLVTIAPETEGALDFIEEISKDVVCSIGHTHADYETTKLAIEKGAKTLTHTFNAMPGIKHRDPGVIPAAVEAGIYAELITDGVHIHPAVVYAAYKLFGKDRLIIISDAMRAAGLADGEYDLGGQMMRVKDGQALSPDGKIAGGTGNGHTCVTNAISYGIPEADAIRMMTINPATLIGEDHRKGSIAVGKDADFLITDDALNIHQVYINGALYEQN